MKVVALGGAGFVGRAAVRVIARFPGIEELIIADVNDAEATRLVHEVTAEGSTHVRAQCVNVERQDELQHLFADVDVVLNTTGPFYRFGLPILQAAIATKTHCLDICDDWEPTLQMLQLHQKAVEAGVIAVIGMGASPGISNLLAVLAKQQVDVVTDLFTAWPVDVPLSQEHKDDPLPEGASAALVHWMQQISGSIRIVEQGVLVDRPPLTPVVLNYPGSGVGTAYTVGHPEPLTLSTHLEIKGNSSCVMVITPGTLAYLDGLRHHLDRGQLTNEQAAHSLQAPSLKRRFQALLRSFRLKGPGHLPAFFVLLQGLKQNQAITVGARLNALPHGMDNCTGIPLALGLRQLLDGLLTQPGVHAPESIIVPPVFFNQLAPYCVPPYNDGKDIFTITTHLLVKHE